MFSRVMKNTFFFVLAALMLLTVACSSKDVEPDQTDLSIREQALVGDISLPSVDQRIGWAMEDNEDQFLLSGTYKDTDFQQAVSLLNSLEEWAVFIRKQIQNTR